jgi:hypothetical protein
MAAENDTAQYETMAIANALTTHSDIVYALVAVSHSIHAASIRLEIALREAAGRG